MKNGVTPENEQLLIQAFKEGNYDALRNILKEFYKNIVFFAGRLIGDESKGEEIVSDIFMKLFRKRAEFKTVFNIKAFLYISTRNACFDWLKVNERSSHHLRVVSLSEHDEAYNIAEPTNDEPFWAARDLELITKIKGLTKLLPAQCREIFIRHYFKGERVNDIARELNVAPATVSKQLKRARTKIRASLFLTMLLIIGVIIIIS